MGKLQRELVKKLIEFSPQEKGEIGDRIVRALGGDPTPKVTRDLPPRRGRQDGGIDGRIPILSNQGNLNQLEAEAGFNIKIEKKQFSRLELNGFVGDLQGENLHTGIIVTASGLAPDAKAEVKRHNANNMELCHLLLEDLLSGEISCNQIQLLVDDWESNLKASLRRYYQNNK